MADVAYKKEITALLVIDPYNDFISEGGKVWDRLKTVAEANDCVAHMLQVLNAARKVELRVFYALHRRYRPWRLRDLEVHCASSEGSVVAQDLRIRHVGGEIRREFEPQPGDIVALEHWGSSSFANTDLDLQLKKQAASDTISLRKLRRLLPRLSSMSTAFEGR